MNKVKVLFIVSFTILSTLVISKVISPHVPYSDCNSDTETSHVITVGEDTKESREVIINYFEGILDDKLLQTYDLKATDYLINPKLYDSIQMHDINYFKTSDKVSTEMGNEGVVEYLEYKVLLEVTYKDHFLDREDFSFKNHTLEYFVILVRFEDDNQWYINSIGY